MPKKNYAGAVAAGRFSKYIKSTIVSGAAWGSEITISGLDPRTDELISVIEMYPSVRLSIAAGAAKASDVTVTGITTSDQILSLSTCSVSSNNLQDTLTNYNGLTLTHRPTDANDVQSVHQETSGEVAFILWNDTSAGNIDVTAYSEISSLGKITVKKAPLALVSAGAYDHTGGTEAKLVTKTDAFLTYSWRFGDKFQAISGTTSGTDTLVTTKVEIVDKIDKDNIVLGAAIVSSSDDVSALVGSVYPSTSGSLLLVTYADRQILNN